MRKMMNKKGFTLVELMIVVVILGILVAIAVPIYSAVTRNAKKRACEANVRTIRSNVASFVMTAGPDDGALSDSQFASTMGGTAFYTAVAAADANRTFAKTFDDGEVPVCPTDKTTAYEIVKANASEDLGTNNYTVICKGADCPNSSH